MVSEFQCFREELRDTVHQFRTDDITKTGINIHVFGPQGSGKTSFIRTVFRALLGGGSGDGTCVDDKIPKRIRQLEKELHRTDDGTSKYSVYKLTENIKIHDTRGQREYTETEQEQLRVILEGRALGESVIEQRKRYWLF